jgi:hypothetical protein
MTNRLLATIGAAAMVVCAARAPLAAQEGHPMTGTWVGEWGPAPAQQTRVVIVMKWTGTELAGTINPGPKAVPFRTATVNPEDWSVHIEADAADAQGRKAAWVIDAKLDQLGSYHRGLAGTLTAGAVKNRFTVNRQ